MTVGYPYLAQVYSGWTGSLVVTYGSSSSTIAPRVRESWASFWGRVVTDCYVELGLTLTVEMIANDQARITGSGTFSMTFSGTLGGITDFGSGPYSGANSYTSDANTPDNVFTVDQVAIGPDLVLRPGRVAADGALAAVGLDAGAPLQILVVASPAFAWGFPTAVSGVYDVAYDARLFARVRIDGWVNRPVGRRRDVLVTLEAQAQAVSE